MCLGVPGRITHVDEDGALRMGRVRFGAIDKEVCLAYTPAAGPGDWVVVHAGFAISQVDAGQAVETLALLGAPLPAEPA